MASFVVVETSKPSGKAMDELAHIGGVILAIALASAVGVCLGLLFLLWLAS